MRFKWGGGSLSLCSKETPDKSSALDMDIFNLNCLKKEKNMISSSVYLLLLRNCRCEAGFDSFDPLKGEH